MIVSGAWRYDALLGDRSRYPGALSRSEDYLFCLSHESRCGQDAAGIDEVKLVRLPEPWGVIREMRAAKLDVFFDFTSWQRLTAGCAFLSGARFVGGFRTAGQYRHRGYDLTVDHSSAIHEVDNFRQLAEAMGVPAGMPPRLLETECRAPEILEPAKQGIVFHPWASGARSHLREWPEERWVATAKTLAAPDTLFLVTGSPADRPRSEQLCSYLRHEGLAAEPFIGTDGFESLAKVLKAADLVISVNTGTMHFAAILGAPTVALDGPNSYRRWGPVGPRAIAVESPGPCCGYLNLGFEFDGKPTDCMKRISVDMVLEAVAKLQGEPDSSLFHGALTLSAPLSG